jgi:hypothetical protein
VKFAGGAIKNCRSRFQRVKLWRVKPLFFSDNLKVLRLRLADEPVELIHA